MRTDPRAGGQMPTSTRTSDVLPDPLGPMTPSTSPAVSRKRTLPTIARWPSGGTTTTSSTSKRRCGGGSSVRSRSAPTRAKTSDRRRMLSRAAMKPRQFAIAVSIGASARAIMIEAAIIAPAVSSPRITR